MQQYLHDLAHVPFEIRCLGYRIQFVAISEARQLCLRLMNRSQNEDAFVESFGLDQCRELCEPYPHCHKAFRLTFKEWRSVSKKITVAGYEIIHFAPPRSGR